MGQLSYTTPEIDALLGKVGAGVVPMIGKGENLFDNGCFVGGGSQQGGGQFPINQRGQTSYTGSEYGLDRWAVNDNLGTVIIQPDCITVTTGTRYAGFMQLKELASLQEGLTYTLSILTSSGLYWRTFVLNKNGSSFPAGWFGVDGLYSYIGVFNGVWRIYLVDNADGITHSVDIKAAKLELGSEQTLARNIGTDAAPQWVLNDPPPNFQQELAKCQRYLIELNPYGLSYAVVGTAIGYSTTAATGLIPLPVPMNKIKSVSISGNWCLSQGNAGRRVPITSIYRSTVDGATGNSFACTAGAASGLADGTPYIIFSNNDSTARMLISAEL